MTTQPQAETTEAETTEAKKPAPAKQTKPKTKTKTKAPAKRDRRGPQPVRGPTKGAQVIALLQQPGGTTLVELTSALGILPHTARAYVSVETRKRNLKAVSKDGHYTLVAAAE